MEKVKKFCPFCKFFDSLKERNEAFEKPNNDYTVKYSVALVQEIYYRGDFTGCARYDNYTLNFCPTCGKSLTEA